MYRTPVSCCGGGRATCAIYANLFQRIRPATSSWRPAQPETDRATATLHPVVCRKVCSCSINLTRTYFSVISRSTRHAVANQQSAQQRAVKAL